MITQDSSLPPPEGFSSYLIEGETAIYYFHDDKEIVADFFRNAKGEKQREVLEKYSEFEKRLQVSKHDYYDMLAAVTVGASHKGKTIADTKQAFKDAVSARQQIQDKRDALLEQINAASLIDDINLILIEEEFSS